MTGTLTINARGIGRAKPLLADWSIPYPPDVGTGGGRVTLRELIAHVVRQEVRAFRDRQSQRRLLQVLTEKQIQDGLAKGKVFSGGSEVQQDVDEEAAVGTALQAFADGLFLVLADGVEQRELDREVILKPESRITFLRLIMLAGG